MTKTDRFITVFCLVGSAALVLSLIFKLIG
jgi:hypothetical protein